VTEQRPRHLKQTPYVMCVCGKRGWTTRRLAKEACKGVSNRFRVYRCSRSYYWHITSELDSDAHLERLHERDRRPVE
jgi:hypothetical protein